MDAIHRRLQPPVATAVIVLLVAAELAAVLGFSISYAGRGRRIADLEEMLCRERLAKFSRLASGVPCPDAEKLLAQALPQIWMPVGPSSSSVRPGARIVGWRPPRGSLASPASMPPP